MPNLCKKCNTVFPFIVVIKGKQRNLSTRKYCLKCSPFGKHNTVKIDVIKKRTAAQKRIKDNEKFRKWQRKARKERKEKLIEIHGGKCERCGYNKCIAALQFHHINAKNKKFGLGELGLTKKWATLLKESKKCQLLCANCHAEIHYSGILA